MRAGGRKDIRIHCPCSVYLYIHLNTTIFGISQALGIMIPEFMHLIQRQILKMNSFQHNSLI